MKIKNLIPVILFAILTSCSDNVKNADAYGNFEVTDVLVSSEVTGKILKIDVEEGQQISPGQLVGVIDTIQLVLKKEQLLAQIDAVNTKTGNISSQVDVQNEQKKTLLIEKERLEKLLKDGAATAKQMDDLNGKINVIESQIKSIETQNTSVSGEIKAMRKQLDQIEDMIKRSYIINPISGTVLEKYAELSEITIPGKAMYKIANLDELTLRIYISGEQLSSIKIGQKVKVFVDVKDGKNKEFDGEISWVSQQAEFTPKIIQTKEERVNLVYAVKVKVKNDGSLKIGMPGEVKF